MGDRSRSFGSFELRLLVRLLSVVAALAVLCASRQASAATQAAIPMCGDHNESIAAPPIFRAYQPGSIVSTPCQPEGLEAGGAAPVAPERIVIHERPERVLGFGSLAVMRSSSARLSIGGDTFEQERPGFGGAPFRPPRA